MQIQLYSLLNVQKSPPGILNYCTFKRFTKLTTSVEITIIKRFGHKDLAKKIGNEAVKKGNEALGGALNQIPSNNTVSSLPYTPPSSSKDDKSANNGTKDSDNKQNQAIATTTIQKISTDSPIDMIVYDKKHLIEKSPTSNNNDLQVDFETSDKNLDEILKKNSEETSNKLRMRCIDHPEESICKKLIDGILKLNTDTNSPTYSLIDIPKPKILEELFLFIKRNNSLNINDLQKIFIEDYNKNNPQELITEKFLKNEYKRWKNDVLDKYISKISMENYCEKSAYNFRLTKYVAQNAFEKKIMEQLVYSPQEYKTTLDHYEYEKKRLKILYEIISNQLINDVSDTLFSELLVHLGLAIYNDASFKNDVGNTITFEQQQGIKFRSSLYQTQIPNKISEKPNMHQLEKILNDKNKENIFVGILKIDHLDKNLLALTGHYLHAAVCIKNPSDPSRIQIIGFFTSTNDRESIVLSKTQYVDEEFSSNSSKEQRFRFCTNIIDIHASLIQKHNDFTVYFHDEKIYTKFIKVFLDKSSELANNYMIEPQIFSKDILINLTKKYLSEILFNLEIQYNNFKNKQNNLSQEKKERNRIANKNAEKNRITRQKEDHFSSKLDIESKKFLNSFENKPKDDSPIIKKVDIVIENNKELTIINDV